MATSDAPNQPPNTTSLQAHRRRVFKVEVIESWVEDQKRKDWRQLREPETTARVGADGDYGYVEAILPTLEKRTVLQAEVTELDVPAVVRAVFGLES